MIHGVINVLIIIMRVTISCRYALSLMGRCFCYRQDCPVAANCRYCFYSQAKNHVFRPAEATRCTDSGQTLQDWRAPGSAWPCKISRQSVRRAGNAATKNYKIPLFGKKSPRMTLTLDRFLKFLGSFICLSMRHELFKFHVIRITGYGVIAEKPPVGKLGEIFPCTL